jgi:hypothetical protein
MISWSMFTSSGDAMRRTALTSALTAAAAPAVLLAFAACSDNEGGPLPSEPAGDKAGVTVRVTPDTSGLTSPAPAAPGLRFSIAAPISAGSLSLARVPPTFAITVVGGDTTNEVCRSGQEFCAIQGQAAGGWVAVLCANGPGTCQSGTYQWSIQTPPPKSTTTFTPDTTVTDQFARVSIQTTDSTPPDIYQVTFVPTPLNGSPPPNPLTVPGTVHVLCSFKYKTCPTIDIRDRTKGDSVVSQSEPATNPPTQTTLIGKPMKLRVSTDTAQYDLNSAEWTLLLNDPATDVVKNYDLHDGVRTELTPFNGRDDPNALSVSYYYVVARNGYQIKAEAELTRKGNPNRVFRPAAVTKYNAKGPTNVTLGAEATTVVVGLYSTEPPRNKQGLSLGNELAGTLSYGIHWTFTATAPDTDGYVTGTQLISSQSTYTPYPRDTLEVFQSTGGAFRLDACNTYRGADPRFGRTPHPSNGQYTYVAYDAPVGFLYPDFNLLTRADTLQMFFMYRPGGSESIWVPVGVYSWGWGGTATRLNPQDTTSNVWTLASSHQSTPGVGKVAPTFPVWFDILYPDPGCPALPSQ